MVALADAVNVPGPDPGGRWLCDDCDEKKEAKPIWEEFAEAVAKVPESELDKLPIQSSGEKITIDLFDMVERVQHGYHLTNEECRWLLAQIGYLVPRVKRCDACHGHGTTVEATRRDCGRSGTTGTEWVRKTTCQTCGGKGYIPQPEPEYEVRT
jgi:hypothetical protein